MAFRMFYTDYLEDKSVASHEPIEATLEEVLNAMDRVLYWPENFLGIVDDQETTLQFMVNDDKSIEVDVPVPTEQGSYAKATDLSECFDIVRDIRGTIDVARIAGLVFQKWGRPL